MIMICIKLKLEIMFGTPLLILHLHLFRIPSDSAVARAKQNIERFYLTVGLTERLSEFFMVLENRLPVFYKGAHSVYKTTGTPLS